MADRAKHWLTQASTVAPVPIEKSADCERDMGDSIEANSVAEMLSVTPDFEVVGTTYKPKKAAEDAAASAHPLGEPTTLCSRRMKVS